MRHHFQAGLADSAPCERSSTIHRQGFGQPTGPQRQQPGDDRGEPEHGSPRQHGDEPGTDARSHDRHQQEHGHDHRHQARHRIAVVAVADHGHAQRARAGGAHTPHEARDHDQLPRRRECCGGGTDGVQRQAGEQRDAPPEPVGGRPVEPRAGCQAQEVGRDDPRDLCGVGGHAELLANLGKRRQHQVDADRSGGHERGDEQDELAPGRDALGVRLLLADRGMFGIGQRHGCHDTSESSTANYRRSGAGWLLNRPARRLEATVTRCISRSYMG